MEPRTGSIHKALILRLLVAAIALASGLGTAAFFVERSRIGEAIAEYSNLGAELLQAQVRNLLRTETAPTDAVVQSALEDVARVLPQSRAGQYVFVVAHNADRREIARLAAAQFPTIDAIVESSVAHGFRFPASGMEFGDTLPLGERPHVPVAMTVTDGTGKTIGYLNGVFVVSKAAMARFDRSIVRSVIVAVVIVLITTALIYPIIRKLTNRLTDLSVQLLDSNLETIQALGRAIAKRDSDTDAHNYRVTVYSVRLAESIGLRPASIRSLIKGAFLHDVGKIGIRDSVLLKPGRLDEHEFEEMKMHVSHGLDIVHRAEWLKDAAEVVGNHHEKYDGSGYLQRLSGDGIPINARIFAIADVFDALTSERPYKRPMGVDETLTILAGDAGKHFDPKLVSTFQNISPALHADLTRDEDAPKRQLDAIIHAYFRGDIGVLLYEATA